MSTEPVVYIVDDDSTLREALCMLFESVCIRSVAFNSGAELLDSGMLQQTRAGCLLADVRLPGISGITLLERLREAGIEIPTIVITAYGDIPMAVRAMKLGAVDFITKPFNPQTVLELVQKTLDAAPASPRAPDPTSTTLPASTQDAATKPLTEVDQGLLERYRTLTPREQQVFEQITAGKTNRMVADELGISVRTAEFHRARVMKKLRTQNLADLTRARLSLQDHLLSETDR
ncbi:response regulator transcription factor [Halochromatium salexigens]|uniref:DNA-binding response regulator n=1 Tax=Halochromatium salexigens TaxID=49447 RepID=A0AAJ0UH16_HALSE|nr:response regulator [Halochromatium salexigens]MBK5930695.1 DNA-binding response regulator [Halochromatium salexigens]